MTRTASSVRLHRQGGNRSTLALVGEWSRIIPLYARGRPGSAFTACGLTYLSAMGAANSEHNVEQGFLFAAPFVWDGEPTKCSIESSIECSIEQVHCRAVTPNPYHCKKCSLEF